MVRLILHRALYLWQGKGGPIHKIPQGMRWLPVGHSLMQQPVSYTHLDVYKRQAANEAEIPVINLGPGVDAEALADAGGHLDGKITVNFEEQGSTVANDMISRMEDGGKVAILAGLEAVSYTHLIICMD